MEKILQSLIRAQLTSHFSLSPSSEASLAHKAHKRIRELILFGTSSSLLSLLGRARSCEAQWGTATKPLSCRNSPVHESLSWWQHPHCHPLLHPAGVQACPQGHGSWLMVSPGCLSPPHPGLSVRSGRVVGGKKPPPVLPGNNIPRLCRKWKQTEDFCKHSSMLSPLRRTLDIQELCRIPQALLLLEQSDVLEIFHYGLLSQLVFQLLQLFLWRGRVQADIADVPQACGHWLQVGMEAPAPALSVPTSHPNHKLSTSLGSLHLKSRRK